MAFASAAEYKRMFQRQTAVAGVRGGIFDPRPDFGAEYGLDPHPNGTDAGGW